MPRLPHRLFFLFFGKELFVCLTGCGGVSTAAAQEDLLERYGSEALISLATGYSQPVNQAPAVSTVITAAQIERLGVTTLAEVLRTVPGLHVSTARGLSDIYVIRGFAQEFNLQLLLQVNGVPVNDVVNGGRPQAWAMPVHNIARIEIIRGPMSALHGADAFAGVINVITRQAADIDGTEAGLYGGSFDTAGAWLLHGTRWRDLDIALSLQASTTDGDDGTVSRDDQTRIDRLLGTGASLAPGAINTRRDDVNLRVDIAGGERWRLRAGYQGFLNVGTGVGVALALDPVGEFDVELLNADLTYRFDLAGHWPLEARFSYLGTTLDADLVAYPPGAFAGRFPQGLRERFGLRIDQWRADLSGGYDGLGDHRLRFGFGFSYAEVDDVEERRNFVIGPAGLPAPTRFADVAALGVAPFITAEDRRTGYGFLQDEWRLAPDWTLTTGVRVDHYSDFGTTWNPRLSLVWNASPTLTVKALYGRAFRPPDFTELYGNSALAVLPNPDLEPETLDMVELAAVQRWTPRLQTGINAFWYETDDLLVVSQTPAALLVPAGARNTAGTRGWGMEADLQYRISDALTATVNYAYQNAEQKETDETTGFAPAHQAYGELDWRLGDRWRLNTRLKWVGEIERGPGDHRDPVDDAWLLDAALRYQPFDEQWSFALTGYNLLDDDAREPSLSAASIPDDIPLAGRRVMAQFQWRFR